MPERREGQLIAQSGGTDDLLDTRKMRQHLALGRPRPAATISTQHQATGRAQAFIASSSAVNSGYSGFPFIEERFPVSPCPSCS